ncbi:hypothetical protein L6452_10700 [Arctium lappa]|uniref:Uncharacterized protein n=1 Tax=Arctium lappa TaxID=4217 RepID=A0ACB9DN23_ARCLA|nr:hypothetical protein L6452_10700 [Arctium lappa]
MGNVVPNFPCKFWCRSSNNVRIVYCYSSLSICIRDGSVHKRQPILQVDDVEDVINIVPQSKQNEEQMVEGGGIFGIFRFVSLKLWGRLSALGKQRNTHSVWQGFRSRDQIEKMGEEEEDPQKMKKIAAAAYDYDNDPRWADYWSNVLMPPHMASRPDVINHYKRKFYHRYIDPDLVVEPMTTQSTSKPAKSSAPSSSSTSEHRPSRNSGSTTRATGASTPNSTPLRWDRQTIQFSVNAWVFVVAVLAMFPIIPKSLSNRAYRLSFIGTLCSSLYSLYSLYGKPRAWNLQAVQVWLQSVIATKDFIYFIYCLTFVSSNLQLRFALLPILCRSLEHSAKFLKRNFSQSSLYRKYLEDLCVWVETNTTTLNVLSSQAEIGIGFLLIISLLSWQRNIVQTFMYWQLLKLMYQAPVTSGYHQSVWVNIGMTVNPLIHKYAPFLNSPITAIQRWWFR